jgi:hypothetical protein
MVRAAQQESRGISASEVGDKVSIIDSDININRDLLLLPDREKVEESLRSAGARYVTTGGASEIMDNLRTCLENTLSFVDMRV